MTIKEYQEKLDEAMQRLETPYWTPHEILARVVEEVGELARIINHDFGPKKKKPGDEHDTMGEETADIMFALLCLCNREGIDIESELKKVLNKAVTRDKDRFEKKKTV